MREPRYRFFGGNFVWGENWTDYLRRKPLTRDIAQMFREAKDEMVGCISAKTATILVGTSGVQRQITRRLDRIEQALTSQSGGQEPAAHDLCTLDEKAIALLVSSFGLCELGNKLDTLSGQVAKLDSAFQWGFGEVLGSLGGIQESLDRILQAITTPIETEAYELFDISRRSFANEWYEEALRDIDRAIEIFDLDWRFHSLRGVILLGSGHIETDLIDPAEAEKAFFKAAKYSWRINSREAGKAMMQAGWAAFVQKKLAAAIHYTTQAVERDPGSAEAWFQLAKFRMVERREDPSKDLEALGQAGDAVDKAFDLDIGYIIKVDTDPDFASELDIVRSLFERRRLLVLERINREWQLSASQAKAIKEYGLLTLLEYEKNLKISAIQEKERVERENKEIEEKRRKDEEERERRRASRTHEELEYFSQVYDVLRSCERGDEESIMKMWEYMYNKRYRSAEEWSGIEWRFGKFLDNFPKRRK